MNSRREKCNIKQLKYFALLNYIIGGIYHRYSPFNDLDNFSTFIELYRSQTFFQWLVYLPNIIGDSNNICMATWNLQVTLLDKICGFWKPPNNP